MATYQLPEVLGVIGKDHMTQLMDHHIINDADALDQGCRGEPTVGGCLYYFLGEEMLKTLWGASVPCTAAGVLGVLGAPRRAQSVPLGGAVAFRGNKKADPPRTAR